MNNQDDHSEDPVDLQQKAAELAMERTAGTPEDSTDLSLLEEMRKTIHELRLQQTELERQNEELRTGRTQFMAEESLSEQRDFSESLIETAQTIILVLDTQGRIVRFNPYMEQLVGYTLDEVRGMDWFETFLKLENNDAIKSVFIKTVDNIQTSGTVNSITTKDGRTVHVEWSNKTLKDKDGRTVGVLAIGQDITERKQAEESLRESEERFSLAMEASRDGIWDWDLTTGTIYCSPALTAMLGYDSRDVIEDVNQWQELVHPEDRQKAYQANMDCVNGLTESFEIEYRMQARAGDWKWILGRGRTVHREASGRALRMIGTHQDITERKRIEEALRESESKFSTLFSSMTEMVVLHDLVCNGEGKPINYRITNCNAAYTKSTGIPRENAIGRLATELYGSEKPPYLDEYSKVVLSHEPYHFETYYQPMDKHFFISVVSPAKNQFATVTTDITELKQTQEAIKASRSQLQATLNALPDLLFEVDSEGRIFSYHTHRSDLLATPPEVFMGKRFTDILPSDAADACQRAIDEAAQKGFSCGETYRLALPQGERWFELSVAPLLAETTSDQRFIMISRDFSERKQAQLALGQKNQEMEQFVHIISHDLKNPLVTVKIFAGMLRQDLQHGDQQLINEDLNYIDKAADKMQQLLDALQKYSRIGTVNEPAQTSSADQQVHNCLATLAGILQQHQVQVTVSEIPYQLHGDPLHFGQIWQNLIENAVKYRGDQAQPHIEVGTTQQGDEVVFYVRDNGMGIAPEQSERIFNLFTQLNPCSDGSGLGLALVKKIVSIYQGRIWVESPGEGQGSCFMFTLPGAVINSERTT